MTPFNKNIDRGPGDILTVKEAAELLSTTRYRILNFAQGKRIPGAKLDRGWHFRQLRFGKYLHIFRGQCGNRTRA